MDAPTQTRGSLVVTRRPGEQVDLLLPDGSVITVELWPLSSYSCRVRIMAAPDVKIARVEPRR